MKEFLFVGFGGMLGSCLRYSISLFLNNFSATTKFPLATLLVNLTGCFLIGLLAAYIEKNGVNSELRIFLIIGFLGAFTTFSAFSLESINLLRTDNLIIAAVYIAASLVFGLLFSFLGMKLIS